LALPSDKTMYGYLSEHHSFGESEEIAGEYAEELAAEMLATTLNVEFDPDLSWDEKKEVYRISNKIVRTLNVTQSAVGDKRDCGPPFSGLRFSSAKTTKHFYQARTEFSATFCFIIGALSVSAFGNPPGAVGSELVFFFQPNSTIRFCCWAFLFHQGNPFVQ